jgi:hypothetical protein
MEWYNYALCKVCLLSVNKVKNQKRPTKLFKNLSFGISTKFNILWYASRNPCVKLAYLWISMSENRNCPTSMNVSNKKNNKIFPTFHGNKLGHRQTDITFIKVVLTSVVQKAWKDANWKTLWISYNFLFSKLKKLNSVGCSPQANYSHIKIFLEHCFATHCPIETYLKNNRALAWKISAFI